MKKVFKIDWNNKKLISTGKGLDPYYTDNPWVDIGEEGEEISFNEVEKSDESFSFDSKASSGVCGRSFEIWKIDYPKKGLECNSRWHILNFDETNHKLEEWIVKSLMVKDLERAISKYKEKEIIEDGILEEIVSDLELLKTTKPPTSKN